MRNMRSTLSIVFAALLLLPACAKAAISGWLPYGPDGGDARSIASDPHNSNHLYMGTANGWIYESSNGGAEWKRLAQVGKRDDLVIDSIIVDPNDTNRILVGAWVLGSQIGGLYTSDNSGETWQESPELKGQSILALSNALSDNKIYIAGTLKGVYRSNDSGKHWGNSDQPRWQQRDS